MRQDLYPEYDYPFVMIATCYPSILLSCYPAILLSFREGSSIIGAELATVVIGRLLSSTVLTLIVEPVMYTLFYETAQGRRVSAIGSDGLLCVLL